MDTIDFVDTTIRDGHQSLWAENMTTGMMLPIAKNLDDAGFEGIELISGSHLKKTVRELKEDPVGARSPDIEIHHQDAAAAHRRPGEHVRIQSAVHVSPFRRAHVRQRHQGSAHFR